MDEYGPATYGDRIAEIYDEWYANVPILGDVAAIVEFLRGLAGPGPALELGIGTGRVAVPLWAAGVEVHGIDASQPMVDRLRQRTGASDIPVTIGDFRDFSLDARFRVVYVVFNTFFGLLSQDDQVTCFRAIARHLTDDGAFVMEAFVPDPTRFDRGQRVSASRVEPDVVALEVSTHDALEQRTNSQHVVIRTDGVRLYPVRIRYAFVSELDLMARLAGMRLRERWADWDRSPLSSTSQKHVSVWELDGSRA
jgi:ubiquinone/menaquinone biosynthesis C-methylase UbiE